MEKNNEKYFILFKLSVIAFTIIVSSYAWFVKGTKMDMDSLLIKTKAVQNLSFSLDGGVTWNDKNSLNLEENFKFGSEITGDGVNFYVPLDRREDGTPITFAKAVVERDYIEFEIRFKSDNPVGIFLDKESFVNPTAGTLENELIGSEVLRKSISGNFSRDLIAGAVRVAFIENDIVGDKVIPKEETKLVWAPNSNYELVRSNEGLSFLLDSNKNQDYSSLDPNTLKNYRVNNLKDNIKASYDHHSTFGEPMLLHLDEKDQVKSLTVRVWVEGNDREADTALKGGVFRIFISFMGMEKLENKNIPNVEVSDNKISGYSSGMEYSRDYGNRWITYKEDNEPIFNKGDIVYVRESETIDVYASNSKVLNF